jgi:uncharacterized protein (DUF1501 family)
MDRRLFLRGLATAACSAAAHPLMTTVTLAGTETGLGLGDHRLVVVILRGAMDGLDLVRPSGDALFSQYRPTLATPGIDLDGYFTLHPTLSSLMPLWKAGQLGFVHATSTPYRDVRSHFDGQDILEAGSGLDVPDHQIRDGWLNRLLQAMPGLNSETAFAIGREALPVLDGTAPVGNWQPEQALQLSAQSQLLLDHVYHDDPLFRAAATEAMSLADDLAKDPMQPMAQAPRDGKNLISTDKLVDFAAGRLRENTRIAAFSLTGWDTHRNQSATMNMPLRRLERVVGRLNEGLGPQVWGKTLVLAMTEFGRTARENGSGGTDHGTGGVMLLAGGALKGGRVLGRWPGLAEADLFERRDLMPTTDVRGWAAWAMRGLYGIDRHLLESVVFPGLDMGSDPGLLL